MKIIPIVALFALCSTHVHAADILRDDATGISFDAQQTINTTRFQCLGVGVRRVLMFKAYAVTFCLDATSPLPTAAENDDAFFARVLATPGDKLVIMHLVRDVPREKLANAFRESLEQVLSADKIKTLIAAIPGDAHEGDVVRLYSTGDRLTIDIQGALRTVDDSDIARNLWRTWLGPKGVAPSLKQSIAMRYNKR